jgi:hypothetical protein
MGPPAAVLGAPESKPVEALVTLDTVVVEAPAVKLAGPKKPRRIGLAVSMSSDAPVVVESLH